MSETTAVVDLGFASARVPAGAHICQVYSDDRERDNALLRFVARGLASSEATACFSDACDPTAHADWFSNEGISLETARQREQLSCSSAEAVYFQDGVFDPERMLKLLAAFHEGSLAAGHKGARVIGEMSPAITQVEGGSRLFEYEGKVNSVLRRHPVTAVCQYDARKFSGALIMDVLAVHPLMFINGSVIQNPFFVPAEDVKPQ